jgi:hypothetical protein
MRLLPRLGALLLLRFLATMSPSANLSSSTDFLGSPVIRFAAPPISRRDEEGFSSWNERHHSTQIV